MIRPNKNRILKLHGDLIKNFGGQDLYPTLIEKAARLAYGLIKNHPFLDGNKRIGAHAMLVFLEINGVKLHFDDAELIRKIYEVADNSISYENFLGWLEGKIYEN